MREIKFRARASKAEEGLSIKKGEWVYGFLVLKHNEMCADEFRHFHEALIFDKNVEDYIEIDIQTVGQFTGLKDKNGKEIYEGDILKLSKTSLKDMGGNSGKGCGGVSRRSIHV